MSSWMNNNKSNNNLLHIQLNILKNEWLDKYERNVTVSSVVYNLSVVVM